MLDLNKIFGENTTLNPDARVFMDSVLKQHNDLGSLFEDTDNASEKETIVAKTMFNMVKENKPYGPFVGSKHYGAGEALSWMRKNEYIVLNPEEDKITLTNKMFSKLFAYTVEQSKGAGTSFLQQENGNQQNVLLLD